MNDEKEKQQMLQAALSELQQSRKTLLLSTLNDDGFPEISYAPCLRDEAGCFYIFISELANHTQNLMSCPKASLMFIADERDTQNLFARERLVYKCEAYEVEKEAQEYELRLDELQQRFGNIVSMLRTLPDFHLFRLAPYHGSYVVGFGRAYDVDPKTGKLVHISEEKVKDAR